MTFKILIFKIDIQKTPLIFKLIVEASFLAVAVYHLDLPLFFIGEIKSLININNLGKLGFMIVQDPADPTDDSLAIHNCFAPSDPKQNIKPKKIKE